MKLTVFALCALALAVPDASIAQDIGRLRSLQSDFDAIGRGQEILNNAPDALSELFKFSDDGRQYQSEAECLGALQVVVSAAALYASALPFSSTQTFEDERGPVARLRLLVNGNRLHAETFCTDKSMQIRALPWGKGNPKPEEQSDRTIDAAVGLVLLLALQGAFDEGGVESPATEIKPSSREERSPGLASGSDQPAGEPGPLSDKEIAEFHLAVRRCWNVGSLSTEALRTQVTVELELDADAKPLSVSLISSEGGNAVESVFESARRAIIRCGGHGYALPKAKFEYWKSLKLTFDPTKMRIE